MPTPRAGSSASPVLLRLTVLLATLALVAAACGGGDDDGGDEAGGARSTTTVEDEGDPQPGGKVVYGLEADSASPWTPQNVVCAISCHMVMRSVFDPLTLPDDNGDMTGNLLESIEPNDDRTEWTMTVRDGVTFHDGEPLNAAAVVDNLERHRTSFLTGKAIVDITEITQVDDMTLTVKMGRPWSNFPVFLAGQIGYIASPKWLAEVDADPAKAAQPVGTGPFTFVSYAPGDKFVARKNPNYWRADEGLPYLDEIEYRFLVDVQSRSSALKAGDIDIMHTSNGDEITEFRNQDRFKMIENDKFGETNYILLRVDDEASPLHDVRVRRAMAHAIPQDELAEARGQGVSPPANGPFPPGSDGYLEDTGYPEYDIDEAKRLIEEYEAENGPVQFTFSTTTDEYNLVTNQLIQQYWQQVGIDVELDQVEQGQYIVNALLGDFQAFAWRNHGGFDPDAQYIWWHSSNALDPGQLALNFGRIKDAEIDAALDTIRTSTDDDERVEAAEAINREFGKEVYNIWTTWTVWGIVFAPDVHGVGSFELPDGSKSIFGAGIGGTHQIAQIWKG